MTPKAPNIKFLKRSPRACLGLRERSRTPRRAPDGPRGRQYALKGPQNDPSKGPTRQTSERFVSFSCSAFSPVGLPTAQDEVRGAEDRRAQDALKRALDRPKTVPRRPKGPRTQPNKIPRGPPKGPKRGKARRLPEPSPQDGSQDPDVCRPRTSAYPSYLIALGPSRHRAWVAGRKPLGYMFI